MGTMAENEAETELRIEPSSDASNENIVEEIGSHEVESEETIHVLPVSAQHIISSGTVNPNIAEYLIDEVKKFKCLYDVHDHDYKNLRHKEICWKEIAENLGIEEDLAKSKWRNIRDRYVKEVKKLRNGHPSNVAKSWALYPKLSFLEVNDTRRRKSCVVTKRREADIIWDQDNSFEQELKSTVIVRVPDSLESYGEEGHSEVINFVNAEVAEEVDDLEEKFNPMDTERSICLDPENIPSTSGEADISFLLSMLPQIRKIPDNRKNLFKIEVLKLLQKYEYE